MFALGEKSHGKLSQEEDGGTATELEVKEREFTSNPFVKEGTHENQRLVKKFGSLFCLRTMVLVHCCLSGQRKQAPLHSR